MLLTVCRALAGPGHTSPALMTVTVQREGGMTTPVSTMAGEGHEGGSLSSDRKVAAPGEVWRKGLQAEGTAKAKAWKWEHA